MYDIEIYVAPDGLEYWYEVLPNRYIERPRHRKDRQFWLTRRTWEITDWEKEIHQSLGLIEED